MTGRITCFFAQPGVGRDRPLNDSTHRTAHIFHKDIAFWTKYFVTDGACRLAQLDQLDQLD